MQHDQYAAHAALEDSHWWFTARRQILLALLERVAPPGGPVVDIGCGTGGNVAACAAAGYQVLGLDVSPEAIRMAQARFPSLPFRVSDDPRDAAAHLSPGGTVMLTDVLEHVDDDHALLSGAIAAVPSGGHLLITVPADPTLWSAHDVAFGHRRRYRVEDFRALWQGQPVRERLLTHYNARLRAPIALFRRLQGVRPARGGGDLEVRGGPLNALFAQLFGGERHRLTAALDRGVAPYRRGISLLAVLAKQ